jgi:hypothetical protein
VHWLLVDVANEKKDKLIHKPVPTSILPEARENGFNSFSSVRVASKVFYCKWRSEKGWKSKRRINTIFNHLRDKPARYCAENMLYHTSSRAE